MAWLLLLPLLLAPAAEPAKPEASPFAKRLTALDVALSTIVAEKPGLWRFDALEAEAAALLASAPSEGDKAAVREIADRIDRFAAIGNQYRQTRGLAEGRGSRPEGRDALALTPSVGVAPQPDMSPRRQSGERLAPPVRLTKTKASWRAPAVTQQSGNGGPTPTTPVRAPQPASLTPARGHDAEGVLRSVVSKRRDAPRYAIVADNGRVATFVTPAPALREEFDKRVGSRVGLDGRRGYLSDIKSNHLLAERLTPLETRLR